ncbi:3-deoxy-D-manno-octulosonic acid transferase [Rhodobacteraceae bacterium ASV31]|nr:3-deoxy-D-manno-octulosonic acid transferase [Anianabacter salinae]
MEYAARLRGLHPEITVLLTGPEASPVALPDGVLSAPVPPDKDREVRAFLDTWRPDIGLWTECDLRAELLTMAHDRRIPLILADARTARPDPRPWRWRKGTARGLMARFAHILPGDDAAQVLMKRIAGDVPVSPSAGFIEEGPAPLPCSDSDRDSLSLTIAGRPVWLAAGLVPSELDAVQHAVRTGLQRSHRLLTIIAPDMAGTGAEMADTLRAAGWDIALRSLGEEPDRETQIYIADSDGEMGLWYRLSPIAYIGGTLSGETERHPFEAAALGSAIIHGPNVRAHRQAYSRLAASGATRLVRNAPEFGAAVEALLASDVAAAMAQSAWRVATTGAELTDRLNDLILTALEDRGVL